MKNIKHIFTLFLLATVLLVSCKKEENQTEKETHEVLENNFLTLTQEQFETAKIQLGDAKLIDFNDGVKVTGMIDVPPQNKAVVSSFIGGYVKNTYLLVGDEVKKGQAIVTLENMEFVEIQQQYLDAYQQLAFLKSEYKRQKTLFDEQITSKKKYLQAESSYKRELAKYNALSKKLRMLHINPSNVKSGNITSVITIYAPISGRVTKINVQKGTFVAASDPILEIINTAHVHLELVAFEKDIVKIKKGQPIVFKLPEVSDKNYKAEVHLVGVTIDKANRTVEIHGHPEDESIKNLAVGMFVEATIITATNKKIAIPTEAIVQEGDEKHILQMIGKENGNYKFKELTIKTGLVNNQFTEVIGVGLKDLKNIVVKGAFTLIGGEEGGGHSH